VRLHLAHEMPGLGQVGRSAAPFDSFFACDLGATPMDLLRRGIYNRIAVALKGGQLRSVGLALLHQAITRPETVSVSGHLAEYLTARTLRRSAVDPAVSRTDGAAQLNEVQVGDESRSWINVLPLMRTRALRNWRLRTPATGESSSMIGHGDDASNHELSSVSPVMALQLPQQSSQSRICRLSAVSAHSPSQSRIHRLSELTAHSSAKSVTSRASRRYEAMDDEEDGL